LKCFNKYKIFCQVNFVDIKFKDILKIINLEIVLIQESPYSYLIKFNKYQHAYSTIL